MHWRSSGPDFTNTFLDTRNAVKDTQVELYSVSSSYANVILENRPPPTPCKFLIAVHLSYAVQ